MSPPLRRIRGPMKPPRPFPIPVRTKYSCSKCPAYCCTYPEIEVTKRHSQRLSKHLNLPYAQADERYTKIVRKVRMLRHRQDRIFDSVCALLDQKTRRCTAYEARPAVCREFPDSARCGYYEFLKFERAQQGDPKFIALT